MEFTKAKKKIKRLLIWSQTYTKTDMVYLVKGLSILSYEQIISMLIALLLAIVLAHTLSKEIFGQYKYVLSFAALLESLTLTGMPLAVTQAVSRGFDATLKKGFYMHLAWSLPFLIATIGASIYYATKNNFLLAACIAIISFSHPILNGLTLLGAYLKGTQSFQQYTYYNISKNAFSAILIIIVAYFTHNVLFIVITYYSSYLLSSTFFWIKLAPRNAYLSDKAALSYSKHYSAINIVNKISEQIDKILIFQMLGAGNLAVYTFSLAFPDYLKGILKNIDALILPKYTKKTLADIKKSIVQKLPLLILVLTTTSVMYIIVARPLYYFFFPQYISSITYSQVYIFSSVNIMTVLTLSALQSKLVKKELYQFKIVSSLTRIVLLFLLIKKFAIWGAIYALVFSNFLNAFLSYIFLHVATRRQKCVKFTNTS